MGESNPPYDGLRRSAEYDASADEPHNCAAQGQLVEGDAEDDAEQVWKCARCQQTYLSREIAARIDLGVEGGA